jgi:protease IV
MKQWSFGKKFFLSLFLFIIIITGYRIWSGKSENSGDRIISKNEILHLEINGVIMNGKKFLESLKRYKKDDSVKAVVIEINSPGGAVGPSQEIYYEIMRFKKETKKPVICVSTGLIASGGYYSALACDQIVVAPGAMIGSIGVIMEFANLEGLYDFAKVKRYTIKSGKFKDSGSEYRAMRDDERELFQNMIDEVYDQFRKTVASARNLPLDFVTQYADGRVMTGSTAVKLKFADAEGTFEDAIRMAAQKAKLGEDYHVFKPHKEKTSFWDLIMDERGDNDDLNSISDLISDRTDLKSKINSKMGSEVLTKAIQSVFKTKYLNQPMYLMPGSWE